MPVKALSTVDLPQPLGPSKTIRVPRVRVKSTFSTRGAAGGYPKLAFSNFRSSGITLGGRGRRR